MRYRSVSGSTGGAGEHSHTRGTMNITGEFSSDEFGSMFYQTKTGCFSNSGSNRSQNTGVGDKANCANLVFDASLSWTGSTSIEPSHTHSVSGSTGGMSQHSTFKHGGHTLYESNSGNITNVTNATNPGDHGERYNYSRANRTEGQIYSIDISHTHSVSGSTGGMSKHSYFNHGGHTIYESNSSNVTDVTNATNPGDHGERYNYSKPDRNEGRIYSIDISHTHSVSGK